MSQQPPGADDWDERYGDDLLWSGQPNEQLVVEISDLEPGSALDVGCGEGADAIWLAGRGWRATGIDLSAKALGRAARAAEVAGLDVDWRPIGLAAIDASAYDLVMAFYPALLRGNDGALADTLLRAVAPGGTLLVVHHARIDRERALAHGFDPDDYLGHHDLVTAVTARAGWTIEVAEERERTAPEGAGSHHTHDCVLRARRS